MTPTLTLVRPGDAGRATVGNDGLTDAERETFADAYRAGVGSRVLSPSALGRFEMLRAARGDS